MGKRILFISNLYPNPISPNMAAFNRQQITALREYCEVEVISPIPWPTLLKQQPNQSYKEENGVIVHHPAYYYTPRILRGWYGNYFYHSIKRIAKQLLEEKHFDLIYSSWLYPDSWAAAKLAKQYNLPLFVKVHGTDVNSLVAGSVITNKSLDVVDQAEKVICVSKALKNRLVELGASENKLEVLYNGVDRSIFYPVARADVRRQLGIEPDEFVVLYVGNLKKDKGLDELISAFKGVTERASAKTRLVIIGTGAYRESTEKQVSSLGLIEKTQFIGSQPLKAIAQWMNAASVLCLPSYMEGIPNVVLEALSCGTRVVATHVGGIPELDKGDGMLTLVLPRENAPLAEALLSVKRNSVTANNSSQISSWQQNAQQLYSLLLGTQ